MTSRRAERVMVTGAASGLGLAIVRQHAARGDRVLATDVISERPAALDDLRLVEYLPLDVTQDGDWANAHGWVIDTWEGLDRIYNNAGVAAGGRIELTDMDQWQWILDINLLGAVRGCRTFTPLFKRQGAGTIVNTASSAGLAPAPRTSEYSASKAAIVGLSETLHAELSLYGVQVSVLCPTVFKTNLAQSLRGKDPLAQAMTASLLTGATRSADDVAATVVRAVDKGKFIIHSDLRGRLDYLTKRIAPAVHDRRMRSLARKMASVD